MSAHARKELEIARRYLHDLQYAIDQAAIVSITDPDGNIIYANEMMAKVTKFRREELIGRNHRLSNSGYHPKEFFRGLWQTITAGCVWQGEVCNKAKDGSLYWVDTTIVPFLGADDKPYQYMSIRKDITERKAAEAALAEERARRQYSSRLAAVGELAASIGHEIGNSLTAILSNSELLRRELCGPGSAPRVPVALKSLQVIDSTARRIAQIVGGIKAQSREGREDPFMPTSLARILEETLELCEGRMRERGIDFMAPSIPPTLRIECRSVQISQILLNLINNAIDAVDAAVAASPARWIRVELDERPDDVAISVVDSGPGIPEEARNRIMDPYFTTKPIDKGTGLGLSISRGLAEDHQGNLRLAPKGPHTTFVLTLPKRQSHLRKIK